MSNIDKTMTIAGDKGIVDEVYAIDNEKTKGASKICSIIMPNGNLKVIMIPEKCKIQKIFVTHGQRIGAGSAIAKVMVG